MARVVRKADVVACVVHSMFAMTLCVPKENALTLLVQKADVMQRVIRKADAMALCVRKAKCPDTPCPDGRYRGTHCP